MKKNILILFILLIGLSNLKAQDLIVKNTNDSVRCKIIKQNDEMVFFFTYDKNNVETTNALKKSDIKEIILNYSSANKTDSTLNSINISSSAVNKSIKPRPPIEVISGFRFGANFGAAYWIFLNPKNSNEFMKTYLNELRTGNAYSFTFNYFGKSNLGFGVQYMNFMSKNMEENVMMVDPNGLTQIGNLVDDIQMKYIGVSLAYRMPLPNKKWRIVGDFGLGYSGYINNTEYISKSKITATTIALNTQLGFDYKINKMLSWGVTGTLLRASVNSYEVTSGTNTNTVNLPDGESDSHIRADISIGLRINIE